MNKPKTLKRASRHVPTIDTTDGLFIGALTNPEYCIAFAEVVTDFVFLEERLAPVLASLMGATDTHAANFVLQSISSPTTRVNVMKALLHDSPLNEKTDRAFDEILEEFQAISIQRNRYVHGRWWTSATGEVILDASMDPGEPFLKAKVVEIEEILRLGERMTALQTKIGEEVDILFAQNDEDEEDEGTSEPA